MHPLTGTWTANLAKSRRDPNHQFHLATLRLEVEGDRVSLAYGGVNAADAGLTSESEPRRQRCSTLILLSRRSTRRASRWQYR